ncbi:1-deoxy-D-xylulose-5-phosphate reductoisomerase [Dietzia psychralcaliphila]|uniref:1-deoxy-D-xylulose 5-phosphate reductoisomerase n=1 Tax=Dietzia psychralcaliphila TaxID=139021 RepID=A0AAD0JUA7_9ACTN|nr:1-deoxy-D-xylulose-5-phosphate reductoisomerase [Dietzia psychralcaliphila]AWH95663.1 1-deoxy-D-xylulose-5-phosphate reductoisomerase [Dietzia psychralcaliphila]PTM88573.1 1-deoxy-D-xylulose 5-phosphate reductoisomerase [Dietzia psychralcaliphila]
MTTRVLILGSTGSIGTQALEVASEAGPGLFEVVGLAAGGGRVDLLGDQIAATGAGYVAVADPAAAARIRSEFPDVTVFEGPGGAVELVGAVGADVVLNGIDGSIGLGPTLAALRTGARLALANKESLVAGGALVTGTAAPGQLVPVDSEHSAMAQCLRSGTADEVAGLILTASGGPFRGRTRAQLADVTAEQALQHPTWAMGRMITLNSATLVNKALELIEAHLLFAVPYEKIEVTVHPQSVVHSAVTFVDGATIAKASPPSMKLPIALALGWPDRIPGATTPLDFSLSHTWTFEPVDEKTFPAISVARAAGAAGGLRTAVFNAANEEAAPAFLDGRIGFTEIVDVVAETVAAADEWSSDPRDLDDVTAAESWARRHAAVLVAGREG